MFGLSSREALTTRQTRWTRDVANAVTTVSSTKNQQLKHNALINSETSSPRKSIISCMNESDSEDKVDINQLSKLYDRCDDIANKLQHIEQYQAEMAAKISSIAETQLLLKAFIERMEISMDNTVSANDTLFIPYFNTETFVCVDNNCTLINGMLKFNIEIFGKIKDELLLYPFGSSLIKSELPSTLPVKVTTDENADIIDVTASLRKLPTGIYVMELPKDVKPTRVFYEGQI